ncbi:mannose-6-phosphate isomerase [bacterium]|nr:mannose-6-phosphate isomerase [bacterium]
MAAFYPLTFEPIYKAKIWGGRRFATLFNRELPAGENIGESWEVADRDSDVSVVKSGSLAGMSLRQLREQYPVEMFGKHADEYQSRFPLLLKFLNAEEKLSIQVHPDNRYAQKNESDEGKTEAWYVVDAMPGAEIIRGFRAGTTREKVVKALQQNRLEALVSTYPAAKDDAIFIPPGTVHAAGSGLVICEIQQNSDVTYRVYDYNRTDASGKRRELHVAKALDVISFRDTGAPKLKPVKIEPLHYRLAICDYFSLYSYDYREPIHENSLNCFRILVNFEGHGTIISPEGL